MLPLLRVVALLNLMVPSPAVSSQEAQTNIEQRIGREAASLAAPEWRDRETAFYALLDDVGGPQGGFRGRTDRLSAMFPDFFKRHPGCEAAVRAALIRTLVTENARMSTPARRDEEYMNYFGDLLGAVAAIHDPRSIDPLLVSIGRGELVTRALASWGAEASDRIIALTKASSFLTRQSAVITLTEMLDPTVKAPLGAGADERIKAALLRSAGDENRFVRLATIEGLARLPGNDVTVVLQRLARTDPYQATSPATPAQVVYPVRQAAMNALAARAGRSGR